MAVMAAKIPDAHRLANAGRRTPDAPADRGMKGAGWRDVVDPRGRALLGPGSDAPSAERSRAAAHRIG
jgi:hypothetical protein